MTQGPQNLTVRDRFFGWLDRHALHPELRDAGPDVRRKAHLAVVFAIVSGLGACALGANHLSYGVHGEGLLLIGFGLMALGGIVVLRRTGSVVVLGNIIAALWFVAMIASTAARGGLMSHGAMGTAAIPVVAVVLAGRRSGWAWCLMTFGLLVTLYALETAGIELPDRAPPDARTRIAVISTMLFALVMFLMTSAHEAMKSAAIAELARTERAKAEAEAEARLHEAERMASVGRLAATVAHEINNPLAYIIGNVDHVRAQLASGAKMDVEDATEALTDALDGAERVHTIVRDLNTFSRSDDTGGSVDVAAAIDTAARMAQHQIRHRATLSRDVQTTTPVKASTGRLGQVLLNLLVNAGQAIPPGRADDNEITIRAHDDGPFVVVEVSDTGVGIPESIIDKVTDPFFTTKDVGEGSGLGLAVSKNIVEHLGGRLEIESTPDVGTTIRLHLPRASEPAPRRMRRASTGPRPCVDARRVLVVDDDRRLGRHVRRALSEHEVTVVANGREALDLLERDEDYDLILCDLMMPDITGAEVYDRMRERFPEHTGRFALFTGGGFFTDETRRFLDRFRGPVVSKPFTPEQLRRLIEMNPRAAA